MPIDKKPGESKDDFISRCMSIEIKAGKEEDQAYAICESKWSEMAATPSYNEPAANIEFESYTDYPEGATSNAKRALEWVDKNGWGSCGESTGKQRANQLANREPISRDTIARMASFKRHQQYKDVPYSEGCGGLMWDAWGGDAGINWASRKLEEIDSKNLSEQINLEKISIDYDETLSTARGMELAKRLIAEGNDLYIISARGDKAGMLSRASELGIPASKVFATGSNKAKVEKIKELGIKRHYDNNSEVVKDLPSVGHNFKSHRRVIFNEDFNEEVVRDYKARGFKVHIRSSRKIKKQDKKVWNKLKSVGLSEDHLVFGEIKELNKRWQYDEFCTGNDPILEYLKAQSPIKFKNEKVIKTIPINSIEDISKAIEESKNVDIRFAKVQVLFVYSKRDDVDGAELLPTSREFCKDVMFAQGSMQGYTADQINNLPTEHLVAMGLPPDPFTYRGGFYTKKGGQRGPDTTPFCRHQWKAKVVLV